MGSEMCIRDRWSVTEPDWWLDRVSPPPPSQPQATLQASALVLPPSHPVVETETREEVMVVEKGDSGSDVVDKETGGPAETITAAAGDDGCRERRRAKAGSGTGAVVAASGASTTATAAAGATATAAATRATATATGTTAPR